VLLVGLTGGIGSGKSEVSRRLAALGAVIVDADLIAREVVEPGTPGLAQVVEAFGAEVLAADGSLDRDALAAKVFGDDDARRRLNAVVHPLVGARSFELIAAAAQADPHAIVVNDVPLLAEGGLKDRFQAVIVVDTDPETQLRRLVDLRGMTAADARARMATQASREQRLAIADYVIHNEGDLAGLQAEVEQVWAALSARAADADAADSAET
jgi:dephospho-CoA kinase